MSSSLDKLKALSSRLEDKLIEKEKTPVVKSKEEVIPEAKPITQAEHTFSKTDPIENIREENLKYLKVLYEKLKIYEKSPDFDKIFMYKAMNLSGIGLKEEDFGEVREGKYIQIIAITYEPDKNGKKKAKNISLGYFGKAEALAAALKNEIIEFILRWRYEKAFQNVEHYREFIDKLKRPKDALF
ncbi:MAG: hypothetical protein PHR75_04870 [Sulfurovum sp.]|nr:hypothetical protein [Sulfurovum sp.]MDD3602315.1 hypothetical protein [Sulfurovum sp.]